MEYRAIIKYLYLKGLRGKQIYEDMLNTLGDQCPLYATVKNWTASFKRGKFSIEDDDRSRRPVSVSVPENIDAVHDMILSDRLYRLAGFIIYFRRGDEVAECFLSSG